MVTHVMRCIVLVMLLHNFGKWVREHESRFDSTSFLAS